MPITLNHTIVYARNPRETAAYLVDLFALEPARELAPFTIVQIGPTSLDFMQAEGEIASRHFAFLVSEAEFDAVFAKLQSRGQAFWADPSRKRRGQINNWDDGRGVYFDDPNGHLLEAITRPYGSGGCDADHPHPLLNCGE